MKIHKLLLPIIIPLLISACSANSHVTSRNNPMDSIFGRNSGDTEDVNGYTGVSRDPTGAPIYDHIDIDLTTMNATMVYSEVYNMLVNPNQYVNKVVKASGSFVVESGDVPNVVYPAVLIRDATACCANGLEFLLYGVPLCTTKGGDGYPAPNEEITVVGVFKTYLEYSSMYVHLVDSIWLK